MTPERYARLKELVADALEQDPDKRAAFLQVAAAGDEELRLEAESLIAREHRSNALDVPAHLRHAPPRDTPVKELYRCDKGHYYDRRKSTSCPYCGIPGLAPGAGSRARPQLRKTEKLRHADVGFHPVVGWLVCVEGADRGRSYALFAGLNSIGRSEKMRVRISGDAAVSRESHGAVEYDGAANSFTLHPGGSNRVYFGGAAVEQPLALSAFDRITVGHTVLLFVPLCGGAFQWR